MRLKHLTYSLTLSFETLNYDLLVKQVSVSATLVLELVYSGELVETL